MSQINDCKFTALRGQGFTGSLNDMLLQWLAANTLISRYFRHNLGTIDYALFASDISLTTNFVVEFDLLISPATPNESKIMDGGTGGGTDRLDVNWQRVNQAIDARGYFDIFVNGVENGVVADNNTFNAIRLVRTAGNADQLTKIISTLYARVGNTGSNASIILANLKISSAGTPIHSLAIDDDSSTLVDSIGGNNATVINGLVRDWSYFTEQNNGDWLGVNMWTVGDAVADGTEASFETVLDGGSVLTANATYRTECVMSGRTQGNMQFRYGVSAGQLMASNQKFTEEVVSSAAGVICRVGNSVVNAGATVSNISMREVLKIA